MSILAKVTNFLGGSIFKEIKETVMTYLPPDLSPTQLAEIEIKMADLLHEKEKEANRVLADAEQQLNKRIAEQEGTAKDLMSLGGFFGKPIIFLRGLQRPVWGFATLYMDFKWFFETSKMTEQQQTALIVINVLVLGFLFGERTIKNLQPLIEKVFAKGKI